MCATPDPTFLNSRFFRVLVCFLAANATPTVYLAPRCEPGVSSPRPRRRVSEARSLRTEPGDGDAPGPCPRRHASATEIQPTREYTGKRALRSTGRIAPPRMLPRAVSSRHEGCYRARPTTKLGRWTSSAQGIAAQDAFPVRRRRSGGADPALVKRRWRSAGFTASTSFVRSLVNPSRVVDRADRHPLARKSWPHW